MLEPEFAPAEAESRPLWLVAAGEEGPVWPEGVDRAFPAASGFAAKPGQLCLLPGRDGVAGALFGLGYDSLAASPFDATTETVSEVIHAADVTSVAQQWKAGTRTNHGLIIRDAQSIARFSSFSTGTTTAWSGRGCSAPRRSTSTRRTRSRPSRN